MIGRLRGLILEKQPPHLVMEVSGVGYELLAPMSTFYHLPDCQKETQLYTHLVVREDAHTLYGFYEARERQLFRALIKVNGIGPKVALSILSGMNPEQFIFCVQNKDLDRLTCVPGIGKKTAERLLVELSSQLSQWDMAVSNSTNTNAQPPNFQDAISALTTLGYTLPIAKRAITQVYDAKQSSESLIRLALQNIGPT